MDVPKYALLSETDGLAINYLCNIRDEKDYNIAYLEDKKVVIIRGCDEEGNILDLKQAKSKFLNKSPWVLLKLKTFYVEGIIFQFQSVCPAINISIILLQIKKLNADGGVRLGERVGIV